MKKLSLTTILLLSISIIAFAQKKEVIKKESTIVWTGKKIGGSHTGEIKLQSAYLEFKKDQIVGGKVIVDMNSISNKDIQSKQNNKKLVDHLKSDDFFGVEKYPVSTFVLTEAGSFKNNTATIKGKLTIKDKTEMITAEVKKTGDVFTTTIMIDRSKYDVRYGSKSFFNNLGDKAINDIFTLEIKLTF